MATFGNINTGGSAVQAPPSNQKAVTPFVLDRQGILDHLLFNFTTGAVSNCKAVIYNNAGAGGLPGALLATSSLVVGPVFNLVAFPFPSPPTLNAGTYWAGLLATSGGVTNCQSLTNGIAFNPDTIAGGPSNPFGASPSLASFQYPEVVFYTPVLPAGTAYGQLVGGDELSHSYLLNNVVVLKITIPVAGSISKLTTFLQNTYAGANCKGVIYDATGPAGGPGNLLGATPQLTSPVINGNDLIFSSPVVVPAGDYYIGLQADTSLFTFHLNDSTPNAVGPASYAGGVPNPFPGSPTLGTGSWPLWATFLASPVNSKPLIICCT